MECAAASSLALPAEAAVVAAVGVAAAESAAVVAADVALDPPSSEGYCWSFHRADPSAVAVRLWHCWMDVASLSGAAWDGEAAALNAEHIVKCVLDSSVSTADRHTLVGLVGLAGEEAVHTCFFRAGRVSEEKLQRLENSIGACDRWVDKDAACAWLPPFARHLLDQCQSSGMLRGIFSEVLF